MADRGFGQHRHRRDQPGQIVQVQIVPGIDHKPLRRGWVAILASSTTRMPRAVRSDALPGLRPGLWVRVAGPFASRARAMRIELFERTTHHEAHDLVCRCRGRLAVSHIPAIAESR